MHHLDEAPGSTSLCSLYWQKTFPKGNRENQLVAFICSRACWTVLLAPRWSEAERGWWPWQVLELLSDPSSGRTLFSHTSFEQWILTRAHAGGRDVSVYGITSTGNVFKPTASRLPRHLTYWHLSALLSVAWKRYTLDAPLWAVLPLLLTCITQHTLKLPQEGKCHKCFCLPLSSSAICK